MFCATFVDTEGNNDRLFVDDDAIEHDDHQPHLREVAATPLFEAFSSHGNESSARSTLAGAMWTELVRQFFHRAIIAAGRHAQYQLLGRALIQWVIVGELLPRW